MKFIRECTSTGTCVIRSEHYSCTIAYFNQLFAEAQKDFPGIKPEDVEVKHFAGAVYARTFGIEFQQPKDKIPTTYCHIKQLENIL